MSAADAPGITSPPLVSLRGAVLGKSQGFQPPLP